MRFDPNSTLLAGVATATLQQWLAEAQAAYAQLATGARVVTVSYEGKSVSYTQAESARLAVWITSLQRQLGLAGSRRALRPYF